MAEMPDYVIDLDNSDENADWIKSGSWDVRRPDHEPVTTLPELLAALGVADADHETQAGTLDHFMELPAARPMPTSLRQEIEAWDEDYEDQQAREAEGDQA